LLAILNASNSWAMTILLSQPSSWAVNVVPRLTGLGHSVIILDSATWGNAFDYSAYDIVAFQYQSGNPADITHLVNSVDDGTIGVVFFRGYNAENTAKALGLINSGTMDWQTPANLTITNNTHFITSELSLATYNLGFTYMTDAPALGSDTTVLGNGPSAPALVVHNTRRAVIVPFYGHSANYNSENQIGIDITQRSLLWASGEVTIVPEPSSLLLVGLGGIITTFIKRRRKA